MRIFPEPPFHACAYNSGDFPARGNSLPIEIKCVAFQDSLHETKERALYVNSKERLYLHLMGVLWYL